MARGLLESRVFPGAGGEEQEHKGGRARAGGQLCVGDDGLPLEPGSPQKAAAGAASRSRRTAARCPAVSVLQRSSGSWEPRWTCLSWESGGCEEERRGGAGKAQAATGRQLRGLRWSLMGRGRSSAACRAKAACAEAGAGADEEQGASELRRERRRGALLRSLRSRWFVGLIQLKR